MLVLALATVLALPPTPAPVQAWAEEACPSPARAPESNIALKHEERQRAECLRKAMSEALDTVILPLRERNPSAYEEWMALQAAYDRWVEEACAAVEEARWVDVAAGERLMGTGYGLTESRCLQHQYAWRGFFAGAWAREDWKLLQYALSEYAEPAWRARQALPEYLARTEAAAARAPAEVEVPPLPVRPLSRTDWEAYNARLHRVTALPEVLARRQCALAPHPAPDCTSRFADSLFAFLGLSEEVP